MQLLSCLALVVCLFVVSFALDEQVEKANAYIDDFIEKATNDTGGFIDPMPLEDLGKTFKREVGFIEVVGEAKLKEGKIYGLSSLKRKGNAVVVDLEDILLISCEMTFKKIHATYTGVLTVNDHGPSISLNAKIGGSKVSMFLMVPTEGGNSTLVSLKINKLQDIRISIWGLGPWGWTASIISTLALNALEKPVANAASIKLMEHFSQEIEKVPYPGNAAE